MNISLTLSPENRTKKVKDFKKENSLICKKNTKEISIENFKKAVMQPYSRTWSNSTFKGTRKASNFESMQIIALDFDNETVKLNQTGLREIEPKEVISRSKEMGMDVNFIYSSFSDSPTQRRFRAVWVLDKKVTEAMDAKFYIKVLNELFPESDKATTEIARMWLGGKEILYETEYILPIEKIVEIATLKTIEKSSPTNKKRSYDEFSKKNKKVLYNSIGLSENSSKSTFYGSNEKLKKFDFSYARKHCSLLEKLLSCKEKVWHNDLLFLASNLYRIDGGEKKFKDSILRNPNINNEKANIISYVKYRWNTSATIFPFRFSTLPQSNPDFKLSVSYKTILDLKPLNQYSKARLITPLQEGISKEIASQKLKKHFKEAITSDDSNIYVFKCATGIGKTSLAINQKEIVLLFPTHDLKEEMSIKSKIEHLCSPKLPISQMPKEVKIRFNSLCAAGLHRHAISFISSIERNPDKYKLNKESDEVTLVKEYLKKNQSCHDSALTVFSTHKKGTYVDFENKDIYVFDEDPLFSLVNMESCSTSDLRKIANILQQMGNHTDAQKILNLVRQINQDISIFSNSFQALNFNDVETVEQAILKSLAKDTDIGNIYSLLFAENRVFITEPIDKDDPDGDKLISYITHTRLLENKKYIILSATANEWIYKKLYGDRVKFIDLSCVKQKGSITQYSDKSFSRSYCYKKKTDGSLQLLPRFIKASEFKSNLPVITFKAIKSECANTCRELHFGKCEGSNLLEGKDLKIIGTPHLNPKVYKLLSLLLNIKTTSKDFEFSNVKIKHNGFEFMMPTSQNSDVRCIHFYCLEKELVQAIGRARLIHNNCKVYLFSDYPIPYAEQCYLKDCSG
jgi:hypothetical protein